MNLKTKNINIINLRQIFIIIFAFVFFASTLQPFPVQSQTQNQNSNSKFYSGFADVANDNTFTPYIGELKAESIISGFADGTFKPQNTVSRGEMAKFVVKSLDITIDTTCGNFIDVPFTNTFYNEITSLRCAGIVSGYEDGTFKPDLGVSRGEVAKFLALALENKGVLKGYRPSNFNYRLTNCRKDDLDLILKNTLTSPFCENYQALFAVSVFGNGGVGLDLNDKVVRLQDGISRGEMSKVVWRAKNYYEWASDLVKDLNTDFNYLTTYGFADTEYENDQVFVVPGSATELGILASYEVGDQILGYQKDITINISSLKPLYLEPNQENSDFSKKTLLPSIKPLDFYKDWIKSKSNLLILSGSEESPLSYEFILAGDKIFFEKQPILLNSKLPNAEETHSTFGFGSGVGNSSPFLMAFAYKNNKFYYIRETYIVGNEKIYNLFDKCFANFENSFSPGNEKQYEEAETTFQKCMNEGIIPILGGQAAIEKSYQNILNEIGLKE